MKVAEKILVKKIDDMDINIEIKDLIVLTELSVSKGEKDNVETHGGAVVVNYAKVKSAYVCDGKLVIVIDGDTAMVVDRYTEEGVKIEKK